MEAARRTFNNERWLDREVHRNSIIVFLPDGADVGDIFTLASRAVSPIDGEVDAGAPIVKAEQFFACRPGDNAGQRSIFFGALRSVVKCLKCECVVGVYQLRKRRAISTSTSGGMVSAMLIAHPHLPVLTCLDE